MSRPAILTRADYRIGRVIPTRWMDNDMYGHVNNVVYYSWFDTAVNTFLIEQGLLDPKTGPIMGFVVESSCRYNRPIAFPQAVTAMIRIGNLGSSSVRYEIGVFADAEETASAQGHFIHVYVNRADRRPHPIPDSWRAVLAALIA